MEVVFRRTDPCGQHSHLSSHSIARSLRIDRRTVQRIQAWAQEQGLLAGELPDMAELHIQVSAFYAKAAPPQSHSAVEAYREVVVELHRAGHEAAAIWQRLQERGFGGSYSAVWRLCRDTFCEDGSFPADC